jgi:opacity protein-like surface antigen
MKRLSKAIIPGIIFTVFLLVSPQILSAQPETLRIELIPLTQRLIGDGTSQYPFTFIILDQKARLLQKQTLEVKTEIGAITVPEELTPGFYTAFLTPPELIEIKFIKITARAQVRGLMVSKAFRIKVYPDQGLSVSASFSPGMVVIGKLKRIRLNITVENKLGQAIEEAKLTLESTVGKVAEIKHLGKGKYRAAYTLPPEKHPQVAIVTIKAEFQGLAAIEMLPIPLIGQTQLEGRTKPNSQVAIRIGKKKLGVVDSGESGEFELPLTVPPGYNYATLTVTDAFGNVSRETMDLMISQFRLMKMYITPRRLLADGSSRAKIRLFVIDRFGKPRKKAKIVISAGTGKVSPIREAKPGVYVADYFTPAGLPRGERQKTVSLKAYIPGGGKGLTDSGEVKLWPGFLPTEMSLQIKPKALVADGRSRAAIQVELIDQGGNPLPGKAVRIIADQGKLSRIEDQGNGLYTAWLTSPKKRDKKGVRISASLRVGIGRDPKRYFFLQKEGRVSLLTGKPALIAVEATSLSLQADGASSAKITTKITDATGNPIIGELLMVTASRGRVGEVQDHEDGSYSFDYISSKERHEQVAQISITNPRRDFTKVAKITLMPEPRSFGIGPKFGYITNFGKVSGIYPGVEGSYIFPWLSRLTAISLEAGYYSSSHEQSGENEEVGEYKLVTDLKIIPIFVNGTYRISSGRLRPYVGVGLGVLVTNSKLSLSRLPALSSTSWVFGVHGLGGLEMKLGPGIALVELKYNYSQLDSKLESSSSTVEGNIGGLIAGAGYRFMF